MPKEIVSAEEVLGQTGAGAEVVETAAPVVEAVETPAEPSAPAPGFETPPDMEPAKEEATTPPVLGSVRTDMASLASEAGALDGAQGDDKTPPVDEQPDSGSVMGWRFVKNVHPGEIIVFKDKSTYKFPQALNVIFDEELANKILEVAGIYHIVQQ